MSSPRPSVFARLLRQPLPVLWRKLIHPCVWPVDFGKPDQILTGIRAYYDQDQQLAQYTHDIRLGLEPSEQALVNGPMARRGRVLHVGCGAGREPLALARLGYEVVGIDLAPRMVEAARRHAEEAGLRLALHALAAHEVSPTLGRFDYVLMSPSLYTFIPTKALRIRTLQALVCVLEPGGLLFVSAPWLPDGYFMGLRAQWVEMLRRFRCLLPHRTFTTERGDILTRSSHSSLPAFAHTFRTPGEIEAELREAGLAGTPLTDGFWQIQRR